MVDISCPRCSNPVIEIRNFSTAGALYIHAYTKEHLGKQEIL